MKAAFVRLLHWCGLLSLARWLTRHRLVILTYHGVLPAGKGDGTYLSRNVVSEPQFRWQMRYLLKNYRVLTLSDAVARLSTGGRLPRYSVVVTFDDGFKNNYRYAFPVLKEYGIPATIFLTTGHIGRGTAFLWTEKAGWLITGAGRDTVTLRVSGGCERLSLRTAREREVATHQVLRRLKAMPREQRDSALRDIEEQAIAGLVDSAPDPDRYAFLDWDEVREMSAAGIEIGSHTVHHAILTTLSGDERSREIIESSQEIERQLGTACVLFSYPNGTRADFADCDKEHLRDAQYRCALTQIPGSNDASSDLFELRRMNIGHGHEGVLFIAQVSGLWSWLRTALRKRD